MHGHVYEVQVVIWSNKHLVFKSIVMWIGIM